MRVDVSQLLLVLAERAKVHQEQLQGYLRTGHEQLGRTLGNTDDPWMRDQEEREAVDWALRAQQARARLEEVQLLIAKITRICGNAAGAGRTET